MMAPPEMNVVRSLAVYGKAHLVAPLTVFGAFLICSRWWDGDHRFHPPAQPHRDQMPGHVFRETLPLQFPFPLLGGHIEVRDRTVQRVRV